MKAYFTIIVLVVGIGISYGDLFDTGEDLERRYGKPVSTEETARYTKYEFKWSNYNIQAWLIKGIEPDSDFAALNGRVVFQKVSRENERPMDSHEFEKFLKFDNSRYEWKYAGGDFWTMRSYGTAKYDRTNRTLILRFGEHGVRE